ncbi:spore germination protein [Alkalicoccobacillus murimartini]|uniref:Stage V sporulation protein AF n=1 Tax=Alkalicoccobacillus murimartini TaxID=171685 RepID=A0ABT9YCL7_9BACI|nr:spore germination protein [Alkalicoccobacillus murimartini]MDQ0205597.1 stage V sporulation protein AF [Alkalicoccobacillus murimartini]
MEHKGTPISDDFNENLAYLKKELAVDESFDLICLELVHGGRKMALFLVDGFGKDAAITEIQKQLRYLDEDELADKDVEDYLVKHVIPYVELSKAQDLDQVIEEVLAGPCALLVEGIKHVIIMDTREYPVRSPEEPDTEQVIRGSKDGFVETIVMNAALIRRRVRDRTLRVKYVKVGRRSKSDLAIMYIEDIADPDYVEKIHTALQNIHTDGLPMADKSIEEFVFGQHYNPYPLVRYTERPDVSATHLYEGHLIVLVDGSPSAVITPISFWHHLQHAEEYRQKPIVGAIQRMVRFIAVWASLFLLPLWYLLAVTPDLLPPALSFVGAETSGQIPLIVQFLIAETGIEMLRMASIHTPTALATALGLVAALLIGQVAIDVGLFSPEVVLYLSMAAIGTFATPSYELSLANRIIRVVFLAITALFGAPGYIISLTLWLLLLTGMSVINVPYLWPFIPFDYRAMRDVLFRAPMPLKNRRPSVLHPRDPDR